MKRDRVVSTSEPYDILLKLRSTSCGEGESDAKWAAPAQRGTTVLHCTVRPDVGT